MKLRLIKLLKVVLKLFEELMENEGLGPNKSDF
jgi:hypothetical protein